MKKLIVLSALTFLTLSACTDAKFDAMVGKLNEPAEVKCYSGGKLIYEGISTGAIGNAHQSDGYQLRDSKTQKLVEVSGDCVINYSIKQ